MKLLFTCLLTVIGLTTLAQSKGTVTVVKDPKIDTIIEKRILLNKKDAPVTTKPGSAIVSQMGYRVQVYYGSDRRVVFKEQARFSALYPALMTYVTYKEPNYYLRVGDFRTRMEAQKLMSELRSTYPTLFIFREKINAPNLDYSNDN
ncbi:cell division protein [Pedobacter quisquiliarum]|uniref:Cell division protein n=1 Tax=Pedobacter quisquiliarum TaxID=1834438 RepID=A0A916UI11_9SPHI|nr:SPOR domain-containing protein [Pedobacter quisquiliarum]GGC73743.1 cell division protein [Pedobacter quisquiliarum]